MHTSFLKFVACHPHTSHTTPNTQAGSVLQQPCIHPHTSNPSSHTLGQVACLTHAALLTPRCWSNIHAVAKTGQGDDLIDQKNGRPLVQISNHVRDLQQQVDTPQIGLLLLPKPHPEMGTLPRKELTIPESERTMHAY